MDISYLDSGRLGVRRLYGFLSACPCGDKCPEEEGEQLRSSASLPPLIIHNGVSGKAPGQLSGFLCRGPPLVRGHGLRGAQGLCQVRSHPPLSPLQCTWWKTKEGMTWAHPPASLPAGLLSVAAVSGTCSPDRPSPAVLPALRPPPTGVPASISSDC